MNRNEGMSEVEDRRLGPKKRISGPEILELPEVRGGHAN